MRYSAPARSCGHGRPPRQIDLGAHGLSRWRLPVQYLPPVGEGVDEDEPAATVAERPQRSYDGEGLVAGVGDLDTDTAGDESEPQLEVPPRDPAVGHRVRGEFGDNHGDGVGDRGAVRDAPVVQLVQGEVAGEAGTSRGGAETLGERTYGNRGLVGTRCGHGPNLVVLKGASPGGARVRRGSVRGHGLDSTRDGP